MNGLGFKLGDKVTSAAVFNGCKAWNKGQNSVWTITDLAGRFQCPVHPPLAAQALCMTMNKHKHIDLSAGQDRTGQQLRLSKVLAVVVVTTNLDLTDPQTGCQRQEPTSTRRQACLVERAHKSREETRAGETLDVQALNALMLFFSVSTESRSTEHKQQRFRPRGGDMTSRRDAVRR